MDTNATWQHHSTIRGPLATTTPRYVLVYESKADKRVNRWYFSTREGAVKQAEDILRFGYSVDGKVELLKETPIGNVSKNPPPPVPLPEFAWDLYA